MSKFIIVIDCSDCPCLSRCYDENNCNLKFDIYLMWKKNKELIYCSTNCRLYSVAYGDEVFEIDRTLATDLHPDMW